MWRATPKIGELKDLWEQEKALQDRLDKLIQKHRELAAEEENLLMEGF